MCPVCLKRRYLLLLLEFKNNKRERMFVCSLYAFMITMDTGIHIFSRTFNYLGNQKSLFNQINQQIDIYRDTSTKKEKFTHQNI